MPNAVSVKVSACRPAGRDGHPPILPESPRRYCTASATCAACVVAAPGQVGDGARHLQRAVRGARAPAQPRRRDVAGTSPPRRRAPHARRSPCLASAWFGLALARAWRARARPRSARGSPAVDSPAGAVQQLLGRQRRHFHLQVDAIEQRAAQLALVARDLVGRAAAGLVRPRPASRRGRGSSRRRTGSAPGNSRSARGARDRDVAGLQRLAQRFERGAREFRQLVEEQHAVVRQRDLARPRRRAAAHQRHRAGRVMRRCRSAASPSARARSGPPGWRRRRFAALRPRVIGGSSPAKRCASIDLPEPGGPTISRLWPPAAAISSARLAPAWPLTSARSG